MPREPDWPDWDRKRDPELWDYYARYMLQPGWAGELTSADYEFIRAKLSRSRRLRRKWGFDIEGGLICFRTVQAVAMWGEPSDAEHNSALVRNAFVRGTEPDSQSTLASAVALPVQLQLEF